MYMTGYRIRIGQPTSELLGHTCPESAGAKFAKDALELWPRGLGEAFILWLHDPKDGLPTLRTLLHFDETEHGLVVRGELPQMVQKAAQMSVAAQANGLVHLDGEPKAAIAEDDIFGLCYASPRFWQAALVAHVHGIELAECLTELVMIGIRDGRNETARIG